MGAVSNRKFASGYTIPRYVRISACRLIDGAGDLRSSNLPVDSCFMLIEMYRRKLLAGVVQTYQQLDSRIIAALDRTVETFARREYRDPTQVLKLGASQSPGERVFHQCLD